MLFPKKHPLRFTIALFLLAFPFFLSGCFEKKHGLVIAGSTSVQPLMEKLIESFKKSNPGERINVEGGGSSAGVMATITGTAQIGMASRKLKPNDEKEKSLLSVQIAYDAVVVIVNPKNPVENLSLEQLRKIFSGIIRNWKEVGGNDRPIHLLVREEGSGTRSAFDELVMKDGKTEYPVDDFALVQDSMGGIREVVRGDPDSIGFISMGGISHGIKALSIDSVKPSIETVSKNEYKLVRPFLLLSKGPFEGLSKSILDFVFSASGSEIIRKEGFVNVSR